ncbi:hypothetical protein HDK77DRAFT_455802 [Phyllosticta capitalensis]|uniref:Uncharacterized protein n=1 Tax=Phyllosticta capitalensis TaxID=121624 RepID=A0ABR1YBJ5_9PEZI
MLAAHQDQENIAAAHHNAAAAKPLNHGIKGYAGAKTPANKAPKTPFKVPLNDENGTTKAGKNLLKTGGKGGENQLMPTGKKLGAPADNSAFVTPAGPRNRAPLGMKTTNAKARAFVTPAPKTVEPGSAKTGARNSASRPQRSKVKVHQASPQAHTAHKEERDVEYMPPREVPLPDDPEDWPSDMKYPMLEGKNLMRGIWETYYDPVDDNGVRRSEKREAEQKAKQDARDEILMAKSIEKTLGPLTPQEREAFGFPSIPETDDSKTKLSSRPTTANSAVKATGGVRTAPRTRPQSALATTKPANLTSRKAASVFSTADNSTASMRAAHARSRSALSNISSTTTQKRPTTSSSSSTSASNPPVRHQTATAVSRTTLGYGKGRALAPSVRKPLGVSTSTHNRAGSQPSITTTDVRSRNTSTAARGRSTAAPAPRSRSGYSRVDSNATLVDDDQENRAPGDDDDSENEMELLSAMRLAAARQEDRELEESNDWFSQGLRGEALADLTIDDDEPEFRFEIPAELQM